MTSNDTCSDSKAIKWCVWFLHHSCSYKSIFSAALLSACHFLLSHSIDLFCSSPNLVLSVPLSIEWFIIYICYSPICVLLFICFHHSIYLFLCSSPNLIPSAPSFIDSFIIYVAALLSTCYCLFSSLLWSIFAVLLTLLALVPSVPSAIELFTNSLSVFTLPNP